MPLVMELEAGRLARATPERVWTAFCRLAGWPEGGCAPGGAVWLSLLGRRRWVLGRVEVCRPGRMVAWHARGLGLSCHREYHFLPRPGGVWVASRETVAGWPLLAFRPWFSAQRLGRAQQAWLGELAALAEEP